MFREAGFDELIKSNHLPTIKAALDISQNVQQHYFGQLSRNQVLGLEAIYKIDMDMFGYDIEPYLSYAIQ